MSRSLVEAPGLRYSDAVKSSRPGIASTNRRRFGSFSSLLDLILQDQTALDGLAFAYTELNPGERRALAGAVVQDAKKPAAALGALLAVEEDPAARQRLANLLGRHGGLDQSAFLAGDEASGEALLCQTFPGLEPEGLRVTWTDSKIEHIEIEARSDLRSPPPNAEPVPVQHAINAMTPLLWAHIRAGGALPSGVERFAGFFSFAQPK